MLDYPLDPARPVDAEVRRAARGLLCDAVDRLDSARQDDLDAAVHESRKRLKEVRSLLRLCRTTLVDPDGRRVRGRENDALRDAARGLSGARDAAVAVKTLETLRAQYADQLAADAFTDVLGRLRDRHARIAAETTGETVRASRDAIAAVRDRVNDWRLDADGWDAVADGLKRVYRRGRDDFHDRRAAQDVRDDDPEAWHDWRKRAKDLRYAFEYLSEPAPLVVGKGMRKAAKDLTDHLGDDHDLQELVRLLGDGEDVGEIDPATLDLVGTLAAARRRALQSAALDVGARLYEEKPGAFVKRLAGYWKSAAG